MKNKSIQNIEIYVDYATIPSLNYFLHFAENYQDRNTIRLFGLSRFQIPESIISSYPKGIIRYCPVSVNDIDLFIQELYSVLANTQNKVGLNLHLNLFHCFNTLAAILYLCNSFVDKIENIHICFYDDGAEGITTLYKLSNDMFLEQKIKYYQDNIEPVISDLFQKINKGNQFLGGDLDIIRYLLPRVFSSQYVLLKTDYLERNNALLPLRSEIAHCYQEMNLSRVHTFSVEQKKILLSILNLPEDISDILAELNKTHCFVFIGTTCFSGDKEALKQAHLYFIQQFLDKNSPFYIGDDITLFYKGHPHAKEINQCVLDNYPQLCVLNENIPFEILYLLGFNPKYIGGFASTSYLFLPSNKIQRAIFVVEEEGASAAYAHKMQYQLSRLMLDLGYLSEEKIVYFHHNDIY